VPKEDQMELNEDIEELKKELEALRAIRRSLWNGLSFCLF
jgi:hypothetical protein